jgi:tripeptidyl-peptidase-1
LNTLEGGSNKSLPPPDYILELRIGLSQPNFPVLESHLYEVSNPDNPRYGAHLSKEEVEKLVTPHSESIDLVDRWLDSYGFDGDVLWRSPAKDWVTINVPVQVAEKMLHTVSQINYVSALMTTSFQKYYIWRHLESGDAAIRTTHYSLPENLQSHIDLIQPTTLFARFKGLRSTLHWSEDQSSPEKTSSEVLPAIVSKTSGTTVDASCDKNITITCLKQLYNAVGYNSSATNGNQLGIASYLEQYANNKDLRLFFQDQRPEALNSSYKLVSIKGKTCWTMHFLRSAELTVVLPRWSE